MRILGTDHLDRHLAPDARLAGAVDLGETSLADETADLEVHASASLRGAELEQQRVLIDDPLFQALGGFGGIDAELLDETVTQPAVGAQRLGLALRPVQGHHELARESLPEGMRHRQRLELADCLEVPPGGEIGVEAHLQDEQAQLLEAGDLRIEDGVAVDVLEGTSPPQRLGESQRRCYVVRIGSALGAVVERLRLGGVERHGRRIQPVAVAVPLDRIAKGTAQAGDEGLERAAGVGPGRRTVHRLDEEIRGNRASDVGCQDCHHRARLRSSEVDRLGTARGCQGSEHADLDPLRR